VLQKCSGYWVAKQLLWCSAMPIVRPCPCPNNFNTGFLSSQCSQNSKAVSGAIIFPNHDSWPQLNCSDCFVVCLPGRLISESLCVVIERRVEKEGKTVVAAQKNNRPPSERWKSPTVACDLSLNESSWAVTELVSRWHSARCTAPSRRSTIVVRQHVRSFIDLPSDSSK